MTLARRLSLNAASCLLPVVAFAQGLDPAAILKPLGQEMKGPR